MNNLSLIPKMSMIIAAYAGTGKTTLAVMYPDMVANFVCMSYKYYLSLNGDSSEAGKGKFVRFI